MDLHHHTASETPSRADEGPADVNAQANARKCSSAATQKKTVNAKVSHFGKTIIERSLELAPYDHLSLVFEA